MADAAKEKAEKLAAGRKRYEQLKKQKEKEKKSGATKDEEESTFSSGATVVTPAQEESKADYADTITIAQGSTADDYIAVAESSHAAVDMDMPPQTSLHTRQPSLSLQSRLRSSSFRRASGPQTPLSPNLNGSRAPNLPALSPDGDTVTEIYRKQAARLDELEKDNKRLSKEIETSENRWRKTEEELEELRETSGRVAELTTRAEKAAAQSTEITKLKSEVTSLQRQNSYLQSLSKPRHTGTSPHRTSTSSPSDLLAQLDSKSSTIESMEMEISNLHSQLSSQATATAAHTEQVAALEERLARAERAAGSAQRELADVRRNLERLSEKAVKEGSERTSAETRLRILTREAETEAGKAKDALARVVMLEKKLATLATLNKESDTRRREGERERERVEKEVSEFRRRMVGMENENARLKEERERARKSIVSGADGGDGLDELEDEERKQLGRRVRELEGELSEARRGVWKERKRELGDLEEEGEPSSPGNGFDEVDLSGPFGRRKSLKGGGGGRSSSFATVLSSGFSALTGVGIEKDGSLELDEDEGFDEEAFRNAQEEEGRKRMERVKDVKRSLKGWEGWRLDVVDSRMGGGSAGEIFDI